MARRVASSTPARTASFGAGRVGGRVEPSPTIVVASVLAKKP